MKPRISIFVVTLVLGGILLLLCFLLQRPQVEKPAAIEPVEKTPREIKQNLRAERTVNEVLRQITELNRTVGEATGFGKYENVVFDPSARTITVRVPSILLFARGTATLKSGTITRLDNIVAVLLREYAGKDIDVVAHADPYSPIGSAFNNKQEFTTEQAFAVARYLTERGISKNKVQAYGCGVERPIASNETAAGKAINRRVEVVVHM